MTISWDSLLAAALVGTERQPVPDALDGLAAHALHRRAGGPPVRGIEAPVPAPPESGVLAGRAAAGRLAGLLDPVADGLDAESRIELVTEWLEAGRRVPGELLPPLLDLGRRHRSLRGALVAAGGERVRWLARQRAEWSFLLKAGDEAALLGGADPAGADRDWELAPISRRLGHLSALRRRDPAAARELLARSWDTELPDDRAALLRTFAGELSLADEPLLDRGLADRRKEVRSVAAELLAALPGSGYGRRLADRARRHVRVSGSRVLVDPPAECDAELQRFGVQPKAPVGTGPRAWWLEELVARTPLQTWRDDGLAPDALPGATITAEWIEALRRGLARAAATQRAGDWATVLLDGYQSGGGDRPDIRLLIESLYEALPPEVAAARAAVTLEGDPHRAVGVALDQLLRRCPRPWPASLAPALRVALTTLLADRVAPWRLGDLCRLAAVRLPPSTVDEFVPLADQDPVTALIDTLRFRHDMLKELV